MCVAECPEVGTISQGYSLEEAVANLKEATELYLEEMRDEVGGRGWSGPIITSFEATLAWALRQPCGHAKDR